MMIFHDFAGHSILQVQQALQAKGFSPGPLDGKNGPLTKAAVEEFQRVSGLHVDGIVGPQTEGALFTAPVNSEAPAASHVPEADLDLPAAESSSGALGVGVGGILAVGALLYFMRSR